MWPSSLPSPALPRRQCVRAHEPLHTPLLRPPVTPAHPAHSSTSSCTASARCPPPLRPSATPRGNRSFLCSFGAVSFTLYFVISLLFLFPLGSGVTDIPPATRRQRQHHAQVEVQVPASGARPAPGVSACEAPRARRPPREARTLVTRTFPVQNTR